MFVSGPLDGSIVLGVDPGLTRCGYAVLRVENLQSVQALSLGVIRTPADQPLPERLGTLQREISDLITEFRPSAVAVEQALILRVLDQ